MNLNEVFKKIAAISNFRFGYNPRADDGMAVEMVRRPNLAKSLMVMAKACLGEEHFKGMQCANATFLKNVARGKSSIKVAPHGATIICFRAVSPDAVHGAFAFVLRGIGEGLGRREIRLSHGNVFSEPRGAAYGFCPAWDANGAEVSENLAALVLHCGCPPRLEDAARKKLLAYGFPLTKRAHELPLDIDGVAPAGQMVKAAEHLYERTVRELRPGYKARLQAEKRKREEQRDKGGFCERCQCESCIAKKAKKQAKGR